jgi:hypothetical protein
MYQGMSQNHLFHGDKSINQFVIRKSKNRFRISIGSMVGLTFDEKEHPETKNTTNSEYLCYVSH